MLSHLQIRDLVLIEDLSMDFSDGFNVLTGETGAGKSLVVTSLDLLLGKRGTSELVRRGAESAEVEGLFVIADDPQMKTRLEAAGFPADDELLIRRIIPAQGRHRCYVNGKLASLNVLAELAEGIASVMGQHEHHSLSDPAEQLAVLDLFGHHEALLEKMRAAYEERRTAADALATLAAREQDRAGRLDYISFQLREIDDVAPEPKETARLEKEIGILKHQTALLETTSRCANDLYETDGSIFERLGQLCRSLEELSRYDETLNGDLRQLSEATILVEEAARSLGSYSRRLDADPDRLGVLEERKEALRRLLRKHGTDEEGLLGLREKLSSEKRSLDGYEHSLEELQKALSQADVRAASVAAELTRARRTAGVRLSRAVTAELLDLSFAKADFAVALRPLPGGPSVHGADSVEFMVELNPGEGSHVLKKVASGGELSRMMLALRRALAGVGPVGTYVFDEVDAGIGGGVAVAVGQKLRDVSGHHQVICITHLPQIAALADTHFHVSKSETNGRTRSAVQLLDATGRVEEVSRMLGGDGQNAKIKAAAKELIKSA